MTGESHSPAGQGQRDPVIVIIGGSGVFGARLVEGAAATGVPARLVVAGRSQARGAALVRRLTAVHSAARLSVAALDRTRLTAQDLTRLGATIVVDAAGPFQGASAGVAEAAIAAGCDYLDLADARDFVAAFPALAMAAKAAGVVALSGASSTPMLSHAVLDDLVAGWRRIDRIRVGIAPGNRAPRGDSLVAAILAWVGKPLRVFADGAWTTRPGWSGSRKTAIPGLGRRRLALAETPDLDLLVARYHPTEEARFEAGLELGLLHHGVTFVAWLRRIGLVRRPALLAPLARRLADLLLPFGSDRGGMIVDVFGRDRDDRPTHATWTLVAEAGDGPFVPTLPALALLHRLVAGEQPEAGARAAVGILPLAAIAPFLAPHRIANAAATKSLPPAPFETALGARYECLPAVVAAAHRSGPVTRLVGRADVEGATTVLGRLVARLFGLPPAGRDVPVAVTMRLAMDGTEIWTRDFAGRRFTSLITPLRPSAVEERFGLFSFTLGLAATSDRLAIRVAGWRLGPVRLPRRLAPRSDASESVDAAGRFTFDVPMVLPLVGRIVRYRGWLQAMHLPIA